MLRIQQSVFGMLWEFTIPSMKSLLVSEFHPFINLPPARRNADLQRESPFNSLPRRRTN